MIRILKFSQIFEMMKHEYTMLSYEDARKICDCNDNLIFYESKTKIDGYDISIFNYRLASYSHFERPVPNENLKAYEMRGLCFVFNKDGSLYNRFLLLDKFFNLDQTECSMYSIVKDYKIKNIYNKEDGSIASFVRLPNGKVLGKSKTSFTSDQAIEIQKLYDMDENLQKFVTFCLDNEVMPVFEYVSPTNKIVVPYANTSLILLKLRNNLTGEYLDISKYSDKLDGISIAAHIDGYEKLEDIVEVTVKSIGTEGVIVQFDNGKMIKIKSDWYKQLHRLYTEDLNRENILISMIVNETIDDVLAQIDESKKVDITNISNLVNKYILHISKNTDNLLSNYNGDIKGFALHYSKNNLFPIAIGIINGKDKIEMIKNRILSETKHLKQAQRWVELVKSL